MGIYLIPYPIRNCRLAPAGNKKTKKVTVISSDETLLAARLHIHAGNADPPSSLLQSQHILLLYTATSGRKQGRITRIGEPGSSRLNPLKRFSSNPSDKKKVRDHDGGAAYQEAGMGEHTAFLLLLVATLTLSSEVSIQRRIRSLWWGVWRPVPGLRWAAEGPVGASSGTRSKPRWRINITAKLQT